MKNVKLAPYVLPNLEIINFDGKDIVTASGGTGGYVPDINEDTDW